VELYTIRNNGKLTYSIQRKRQATPKWQDLVSLPFVVFAHETYFVGDIVYILLQGEQDDSVAQIRQIRDLGDGRTVIFVSWYYSRDEVRRFHCDNMSSWPTGCSHMLSNQLQVLMWDTMNGKIKQKELDTTTASKVVDVFRKPCRLVDRCNKSVQWLSESCR
jgi:hypothetical protein